MIRAPSVRSALTRAVLAAIGLVAAAASPLGGRPAPGTPPMPPTLDREFRAAWVTPVPANTGPDWPSRPGLTPDEQRAELRALLDHAKAIGLNAIVLHVRMAADAMYPSKRVPWSAYLTGKSGVGPSPAYDPLAFAVAEAHARGLQLHAWFNPFRAMMPVFAGKASETHVTKAHPSWIRHYGHETWIDPGNPAARLEVLADIFEVVEKYDIDGVHLDDYFYPYRETDAIVTHVHGKRVVTHEDIPFPDATNWKKYGVAAGYTDRMEWRRENIDDFVKKLYEGVKARKPWVTVGISPFGIWKSGVPAGVTGLDAYDEIYADSRQWLQKGWVDYLAPQLYWPLDGTESRFMALDSWWLTQNPLGRHIWPGLMSARVMESPSKAWPVGEIAAEVAQVRIDNTASGTDPGHIHFRLKALTANDDALGDALHDRQYQSLALVPSFPWLGAKPPGEPTVAWTTPRSVSISAGDATPVAWWLIQTLQPGGAWTSSLHHADRHPFDLDSLGGVAGGRIAVTAIDRAGQAGTPVVADVPSSPSAMTRRR